MGGWREVRVGAWLGWGLAAAAVAFLVFAPTVSDLEPLPWDMSHHMLGAQRMASALQAGDVNLVVDRLTESDLYPPGHSILLGCWLIVCGDSPRSWLLFQLGSLLSCLVAAAWCARGVMPVERGTYVPTALALILAMPLLLSLSSSFMLEVPVATLTLMAIGAMAAMSEASSPRRRSGWAAMALLATGTTILTKYNAGLPLLPALGVLGLASWLRGRKLEALWPVGVAVLTGVAMALYLWWQDDGWRMFLAFAENRANSLELSAWARAKRYVGIHAHDYVIHPLVSVMMAALALVALVRRPRALTLAAGTYVLGTMTALAWHPYILGRNLFVAAVVLAVLAAVGMATMAEDLRRWRPALSRCGWLAGVGVAAVMVAVACGQARLRVEGMYHGRDEALASLTTLMTEELSAPGSCRVVGTFNEFSAGWVRLLSMRSGGVARPMQVEFPYPLEKERHRRSDRPDPRYAELVDDWFPRREDRVILVTIDQGSPLWSPDYATFSSWKRRVAEAIMERDEFQVIRRLDLDEQGLHVRVLTTSEEPMLFRAGWGPAESWGRWALARRARLTVRGLQGAASLRLTFAAGVPRADAGPCRVLANGHHIGTLVAEGEPWEWQTCDLALPADAPDGLVEVTFLFHHCNEIDGRLRAMPFEAIEVVPVEGGHSASL